MKSTQLTAAEFFDEFGITSERYLQLLTLEKAANAIDTATMAPLEPFNPLGELERPWPATDAFYANLEPTERKAFFAVTRR